jgi:hypothetical protein
MSWLYWYTKYKQYRDPRRSLGDAIAKLDPAAAEVYKLNVTASLGDVARFISYTIQNNLMTANDWAAILDGTQIGVNFAVSVLNSLPPDIAADIIMSPQLSADKTQAILYAMPFSDLLVYILTRGAVSMTLNTNVTFTGVNRFNTLNLNGYIYTAGGQPHVIIAREIYIPSASMLVKTPTGGAGGGSGTATAGGAGGGGLIIMCSRLNNAGKISADGADGSSPGDTGSLANGNPGNSGVFALVGTDAIGSGGSGGGPLIRRGRQQKRWRGRLRVYINKCTYFYGGAGGSSSVISYSTYAALAETVKRAAVDWVLVNVFKKSPTTTTQFPNVYGSGGGSGAYAASEGNGGGGGGGGGEVIILCANFNNTGIVSANGGKGGVGRYKGGGGGGGGGGVVYVLYKNLLSLGTLTAQGGSGGIGIIGWNGQPGTAGTAKAVAV